MIYRARDVIPGRAPPPLGIFADSDFLKGYSMLNSLQVVCTLAMAALRKSGNPKFEKNAKISYKANDSHIFITNDAREAILI